MQLESRKKKIKRVYQNNGVELDKATPVDLCVQTKPSRSPVDNIMIQ